MKFDKWDVVFGELPHADGVEEHFAVVLLHQEDGGLLVAQGTSRHIPRDGGTAFEVVLRPEKGTAFSRTGLHRATAFSAARIYRVPPAMVAKLSIRGTVRDVQVVQPHSGRPPVEAAVAFTRAIKAALQHKTGTLS